MPNKPIEWEKEFNKKWKNLEGLYFAFVGANKEAKADMKAFISLQRQELVEQFLSGKLCMSCGEPKQGQLTEWCDKCLQEN